MAPFVALSLSPCPKRLNECEHSEHWEHIVGNGGVTTNCNVYRPHLRSVDLQTIGLLAIAIDLSIKPSFDLVLDFHVCLGLPYVADVCLSRALAGVVLVPRSRGWPWWPWSFYRISTASAISTAIDNLKKAEGNRQPEPVISHVDLETEW